MSDADPTPDGIHRPTLTTTDPAITAQPGGVQHWDRPKPPKDWHFWVGGTGRVLMVTGVLMFGFVAYQLWGTGIEYRASQNALENEFEQKVAELGTSTTDPSVTSSGTSSGTSPGASTVPATTAPSSPGSTTVPGSPTTVVGSTTSAVADSGWPSISLGDVIAQIDIPKIHKTVFAVAGIRTEDLKRGLGHYPNTPLPGQFGNVAFAGHRTTYGGPLIDLDQLVAGDEIRITTVTNELYVYKMVGEALVVSPHDYSVISVSDSRKATLTLTTCTPKYSARKRLVVKAELDTSRSDVVGAATPFYGLPIDQIRAQEAEPAASVTPGEPGSPEEAVTIEEANAAAVLASVDVDALQGGWFSDTGAWPQVLLWVGALVAIVLGGYFVSRKLHRYWPGFVAAAIPFIVALYFFYQNVNRLLPPDL